LGPGGIWPGADPAAGNGRPPALGPGRIWAGSERVRRGDRVIAAWCGAVGARNWPVAPCPWCDDESTGR
jgi:hypothetical protein